MSYIHIVTYIHILTYIHIYIYNYPRKGFSAVPLQALLLRTMESLSEQIMHCASPGAFLT